MSKRARASRESSTRGGAASKLTYKVVARVSSMGLLERNLRLFSVCRLEVTLSSLPCRSPQHSNLLHQSQKRIFQQGRSNTFSNLVIGVIALPYCHLLWLEAPYTNYCTIALISHASKVMLRILQARLQQYVNRELPDVHAGFRKGRGTRDQIANI